ncbi:hypothetical protein ID866_10015 [Astraeus odoratus]|nr:hypothetical protein ID866_10015 [Astraeus odoratus]
MTSHIKIVARNLPKLARLILPEFYYTSAIIEELSRMQNLEVIDFDCDLSFASGNPKNVESFFPVLEEGAFPALWNLSITAGIDDMERFFEAKYTPINLTTLHVTSYKMHTPEAVHSFLLTLSRECQHLCCLHLALLEKSASLPWMSSNDQLTYATLQPLFSFPKLTWFELNHKYPVRITQEEVEDLASRWPSLECLDLNSDPILFCRATLDLRAYLPFANHCPNLQQLGLYIHAAGFEAPQSQDSVKPFSALSVLIVGRSTVENPDAVAAFLSLLVPPWCRLCVGSWQNCGIEYPDLLAAVVMDIVVQPRRWEKIIASLPSLLEVRRQDRERTRALQTEVEDLRIQNRLLLDKAGTQTEDSCIVA